MIVDNFNIFRDKLKFESPLDRYVIQVMCRPKDFAPEQRALGANSAQRMIKSYYIDSIDYFNGKEKAIKLLCINNRARAYILPQVRDSKSTVMSILDEIVNAVRHESWHIKPDRLVNSAFCRNHSSRAKRWVIDLDYDNMTEKLYPTHSATPTGNIREWTIDEVKDLISSLLGMAGKSPSEMFTVPTVSGVHVVTPPFNLDEAFKRCSNMVSGRWLHVDGMSLLYYNDSLPVSEPNICSSCAHFQTCGECEANFNLGCPRIEMLR